MKKVVAAALVPFSVALLATTIGVALGWTERWRRLGRWIASAGILVLGLASNQGVANLLIRPLESAFPSPLVADSAAVPAALRDCRWIVVLGSGHSDDRSAAPRHRLDRAALANLAEAISLARRLPEARVVFSGGDIDERPSHAELMASAAQDLGLAAHRVVVQADVRDTHDEAMRAATLVRGGRVVLVTSAAHLPRAAALFRKAGVEVVPCPALRLASNRTASPADFLRWNASSLESSRKAVKERIGSLWYLLRGQI